MRCLEKRRRVDLAELAASVRALHQLHPMDHTAVALSVLEHEQSVDLVALEHCMRNAHLVHSLEGRDMPWMLVAAEDLEADAVCARIGMRARTALQLLCSLTARTSRSVSRCTRDT